MKLYEDAIRANDKVTFDSYFKDLPQGMVLEFGVGDSFRQIARNTNLQCYGFDCFEGLPEDWDGYLNQNGDLMHKRRDFKSDPLRDLPDHAHLVHGLFQNTVEPFLETHTDKISFLHMDADLYSSTAFVLERVHDRMQNGTVIVFDELMDYGHHNEAWRDHEWKAFQEFLDATGMEYKCLGTHGDCKYGFVLNFPET